MSAVRKFLFEQKFDVEEKREKKAVVGEVAGEVIEEVVEEVEPEKIEYTFDGDNLDISYDVGFDAGKKEGISEKSDTIENALSETLNKILEGLPQLFKNQEDIAVTAKNDAMAAALAVSRKVLPGLSERNALGEIERVLEMVLEKVIDDVQVVVSVNDQLYASMDERMESLAKTGNFEGKLILRSDANLSVGDCRIEWNGGGADRDMKAIWREIDSVIKRNFNGETDYDAIKGTDADETVDKAAPQDNEIHEDAKEQSVEPEVADALAGDVLQDEAQEETQEVTDEAVGEISEEILDDISHDEEHDVSDENKSD